MSSKFSLCIILLFHQVLADVSVTFFSDEQCLVPAFTMNSSTDGRCHAVEGDFSSYIVPVVSNCGVTVYDEENPFCGIGSKYVATPSICLLRNRTSQFSIDCSTNPAPTETAPTTSTPTTSSSTTPISTDIPTSASAGLKQQSQPVWQMVVAIVFPILGLLLTCVGTLIVYKSYKRGGRVKDIVQRTGTMVSRAGTEGAEKQHDGAHTQASAV